MIEPGQVYRACKPTPSMPGEHYIRVKVVSKPITMHGMYGYGSVTIVTLTNDGGKVRERAIKFNQLHASPVTKDGQPRRTGYVLETAPTTA